MLTKEEQDYLDGFRQSAWVNRHTFQYLVREYIKTREQEMTKISSVFNLPMYKGTLDGYKSAFGE